MGVEARRLFNTEHIFASPGIPNAIVLPRRSSARDGWKMEIDRDLGRYSRIFNLMDVALLADVQIHYCKIQVAIFGLSCYFRM